MVMGIPRSDPLYNFLLAEMSFDFDEWLRQGKATHTLEQCIASRQKPGAPQGCCIHNRTPHKLMGRPRVMRSTTLIEDICEHGVGHPDPDSVAYLNWSNNTTVWGTHGCDGCCFE